MLRPAHKTGSFRLIPRSTPFYLSIIILVLGLLLVPAMRYGYSAQPDSSFWENTKSDHFIVYYKSASLQYVQDVVAKSEECYRMITEELGFTRYEGFWTWDKRARIYLFDTKEEYIKSTEQPAWSAGNVDVVKREVNTYIDMKEFYDVILPHEIAHIIFRESVGYKRKLPLWMDEGVACYMEQKNREERLMVAKRISWTIGFLNLNEMSRIKQDSMLMPDVFYPEAASIFSFLLNVHGNDKFVEFCRLLRQTSFMEDWFGVFRKAYRIQTMDELNEQWVAYLQGKK